MQAEFDCLCRELDVPQAAICFDLCRLHGVGAELKKKFFFLLHSSQISRMPALATAIRFAIHCCDSLGLQTIHLCYFLQWSIALLSGLPGCVAAADQAALLNVMSTQSRTAFSGSLSGHPCLTCIHLMMWQFSRHDTF